MELICRPRLGRSFRSLPATPTHLLASPPERWGRETPLGVDSLPLEWDHTGDVGGSSSHEDEEEERVYFSALSGRVATAKVPRWGLLLCPSHKSVCIFRDLDPGVQDLMAAADIFVNPSDFLRRDVASVSFSSLSHHSAIQPELDGSSCWLEMEPHKSWNTVPAAHASLRSFLLVVNMLHSYLFLLIISPKLSPLDCFSLNLLQLTNPLMEKIKVTNTWEGCQIWSLIFALFMSVIELFLRFFQLRAHP